MSEHDGGDRLAPLREEHARLQESMADPALHEDAARARRVGRRYAELEGVLDAAVRLEATTADLETARELEELGEGTRSWPPRPSNCTPASPASASNSRTCSPPAIPMTPAT